MQLLAGAVGKAGGGAAVGQVERGPQGLARIGAATGATHGGSQLEECPGVLEPCLRDREHVDCLRQPLQSGIPLDDAPDAQRNAERTRRAEGPCPEDVLLGPSARLVLCAERHLGERGLGAIVPSIVAPEAQVATLKLVPKED